MDSDVSASMHKNSCLKIMFRVCLYAMTGKEFSVKVASAFSHMLFYSKAHCALILNSSDASLNYKTIHTDLSTLPINNNRIYWANSPVIWAGLQITPKKKIEKRNQDKCNRQIETLPRKMFVLFLILSSPSSHTILMTWSEAVWVSQTLPSITSHNLCNPGSTTETASAARTTSSLGMHLLLGPVRDWTYCQQLNNISVSSPYKNTAKNLFTRRLLL